MLEKIKKERLLVAFPIFLLLLFILPYILPKSADPKEQVKLTEERFWANKVFGSKKYDIVAYGDSRILRSISPGTMNKFLPNYRILNFGFNGSGINHTIYKEIENKLDKKSKQKVIILGINPNTMSIRDRAIENIHYNSIKKLKKEQILQRLYFNKLLDFLHIVKPLYFWQTEKDFEELYFQEFNDNGWTASWTIPDNSEKQLKMYAEIFKNPLVSDTVISGLCKQIRIWNKKNIKVFAFRPPTTLKMDSLENKITGFNEKNFILKFEKAGGIWLNFNIEDYHSYDGSHLRKESAIKFSKDLALKLKKELK